MYRQESYRDREHYIPCIVYSNFLDKQDYFRLLAGQNIACLSVINITRIEAKRIPCAPVKRYLLLIGVKLCLYIEETYLLVPMQ